jgi:Uncharacterised nucleotidyltransferase
MPSPSPTRADPRRSDSPSTQGLWAAVDDLLAKAEPDGILYHGLGALGAKHLRKHDRPVPEELLREERAAAIFTAMAGPTLRRVRDSCDGQLILIKGAELARLYPSGGRAFSDIDLLTPEPHAVQNSLLAAGFEVDHAGVVATYHLQPLIHPTLPLEVEVHGQVKWPARLRRPPLGDVVEASVPSGLGIDGILTPSPAHHALILAGHSWEHSPLRNLRDLLDIAVVSANVAESELDETAVAWRLGPLWKTTKGAIEAVFFGGRKTFPLRSWAKQIDEVRDRTVMENHLEHWLSPYWGYPLSAALADTVRVAREEFGPLPDETWGSKLRRSTTALRNARLTVGRHDDQTKAPTGTSSRQEKP